MPDKNIERRFRELSERQGLEKNLLELPKYAIRYVPPAGEVPNTPFKFRDFQSKKERDDWYKETGKAIEHIHGGKMEFYEEKEK